MFEGLEDTDGRFYEGGFLEMADDDEPVIFGLSVHAVVGLDGFGLEDGIVWVEYVLLPEDLHINN